MEDWSLLEGKPLRRGKVLAYIISLIYIQLMLSMSSAIHNLTPLPYSPRMFSVELGDDATFISNFTNNCRVGLPDSGDMVIMKDELYLKLHILEKH